jgi:pyruvate formate lyase activating enzyme
VGGADPAGPLVVDVRRNSLDDGPGIRTVVFFKGCPLRCVWCQNPETLSPRPQVQREPERCVGCGACAAACPAGVARPAREPERDPEAACRRCGACVAACPAAARRIAGRRVGLDELVSSLLRDEPFYRRSGGGVTLSGGEPAVNPVFAGRVAAALRARGVHVLLETSGHVAWEAFARHLLPHLSTIYLDLKLADDEAHRRYTGRSNRRVHATLRALVDSGFPDLLPRVPLVPGITDSRVNLEGLTALLNELGLGRVSCLPYNPLWIAKRRALGLDLPYGHDRWMSADEVERCRDVFRSAGITVVG